MAHMLGGVEAETVHAHADQLGQKFLIWPCT
jgi:hypothetical protein